MKNLPMLVIGAVLGIAAGIAVERLLLGHAKIVERESVGGPSGELPDLPIKSKTAELLRPMPIEPPKADAGVHGANDLEMSNLRNRINELERELALSRRLIPPVSELLKAEEFIAESEDIASKWSLKFDPRDVSDSVRATATIEQVIPLNFRTELSAVP